MVSSDHRMYRTSEVLGHQLDKLCLGPIHRDADFLNYNDFKNAWNTCVNMRDLEIWSCSCSIELVKAILPSPMEHIKVLNFRPLFTWQTKLRSPQFPWTSSARSYLRNWMHFCSKSYLQRLHQFSPNMSNSLRSRSIQCRDVSGTPFYSWRKLQVSVFWYVPGQETKSSRIHKWARIKVWNKDNLGIVRKNSCSTVNLNGDSDKKGCTNLFSRPTNKDATQEFTNTIALYGHWNRFSSYGTTLSNLSWLAFYFVRTFDFNYLHPAACNFKLARPTSPAFSVLLNSPGVLRPALCPSQPIRAMRDSRERPVKKDNLPSKECANCGRTFTWRKKWERCWNEVKYCSRRCRNDLWAAQKGSRPREASNEEQRERKTASRSGKAM